MANTDISSPTIVIQDFTLGEKRPVTPPSNYSELMLNRSLGLIVSPQSPPYRRIRSLNLIASPTSFSKLKDHQLRKIISPSYNLRSKGRSLNLNGSRRKSLSLSSMDMSSIYFNPLTPCVKEISASKPNGKRSKMRYSQDIEPDWLSLPLAKPRLSDFNSRRFDDEFKVISVLGAGSYGCVFKCVHKLNGCIYAIKRGTKPLTNERLAWKEIYAHSAVDHPFIVKNYSSWTEDDHLFLQNEYCNEGSLEDMIQRKTFTEAQLWILLGHVTEGLRFLHSQNLAHLDIKPGNIFVSTGPCLFHKKLYSLDSSCSEETLYKIGDLGHVTYTLDNKNADIEEGDCRYLPKEIINDDFSNLPKADIFALGLTMFEAGGGGVLPKNGEVWHEFRAGKLPNLPHLSIEFNQLIKRMIHSDVRVRPTAIEILDYISSPSINFEIKNAKALKEQIAKLEQQLVITKK